MARTIKVPAHTRKNGVKVKAYSYTVGGKTTKTTKGKAKRKTRRRKEPSMEALKKKNPLVGTKIMNGMKWGSKTHLNHLKDSLARSPRSKYAASWRKKIKDITKLRGG